MSKPAASRSGRPYLEFITVPDLSVGLYVLAAGQAGPPAAPRRGRGLLRRLRRRADHGRRRGPRGASRVDRLRRGEGAPPVPRHHRRSDPLRRIRPGGGIARLAIGRSLAPAGERGELQGELSTSSDLVMAEEHERVETVGHERLDPGSPAGELVRRVVVPAEPEVEERTCSTEDRRLRRPLVAPSAQTAAPASRSIANTSSTCHDGVLELDGQRQVRRPGREERREPCIVASDAVRDAEQDRSRAARQTAARDSSAKERSRLGRPGASGRSHLAGP